MYVHDLDPYFIKLWDGGPIRWYGLSYLLGFLVGYLMVRRVARVGKDSLPPALVGDLTVTAAMGVVIGGRLGYALFYQPELFKITSDFPFWGVLAINRGGMASHGGMLGLIVAIWWFARKHKQSMPHLLDLMALAAPIGLFFGRVANFINGELYGRPASPTLPWAVKFPQELFNWSQERVANDGLPLLRALEPEFSNIYEFGWHSVVQGIIEQMQSGNERVTAIVAPYLTPRHPSQIYEALLEGLLLFVALGIVWMRPRKPLTIGSLFCVLYGVVRIFGEQFREPDADIGYELFNLTRGQWLSIVLTLAGIVLLVLAQRRVAEPRGGWLARPGAG